MKVFISYGGVADQVTALRLRALAAVNGLSVFVLSDSPAELLVAIREIVAGRRVRGFVH